MQTVDLGPLDLIPLGEGRTFVVDGEPVAVFRPRGGGLFATQAHCPHARGLLSDGLVGGRRVICPLHGFGFDLESGRCETDGASLRTFPVTSVAGRVLLTLVGAGESDAA